MYFYVSKGSKQKVSYVILSWITYHTYLIEYSFYQSHNEIISVKYSQTMCVITCWNIIEGWKGRAFVVTSRCGQLIHSSASTPEVNRRVVSKLVAYASETNCLQPCLAISVHYHCTLNKLKAVLSHEFTRVFLLYNFYDYSQLPVNKGSYKL